MYKIIKDNKVIDVIEYPDFIRFLPTGFITRTDKTLAQGIMGSNNKTIYSFVSVANKTIPVVTIEEITLADFNRLQGLLKSGKEVVADESIIAETRRNVLKQLSAICKNTITAGFYITLSNNKLYSFKLTTEDQLNLMNIENQLNNGASSFIYHATDMPCEVFTRDDMVKILRAFRRHTTYHTTYFNVAKQYINSLTDIEKINSFTYGTDVTDFVNEPVIRQILERGGIVE